MCSFQAERTEGQRATRYYQLSVPAFKELSYKHYPTTFAYVTLVRNVLSLSLGIRKGRMTGAKSMLVLGGCNVGLYESQAKKV